MSTVAVTKFKPDDAHLSLENIGQIETEVRKPASIMASKIAQQTKAAGDVSLETPTKLQKAIAKAKEKYGFAGEYAEEAKDKVATVKSQAGEITKYAKDMYQGGKGAYRTYYEDPISYVKTTKTTILSQVRSVAGMRFKIDDLLIGEDARKLLMLGIKSVCGNGGLGGMDGIYGAFATLLKILDNINLFSNSDLLAAISNCSRFTDDHVKVITTKTTMVAEEGNPTAYLDMVNVPDVKSNDADIRTLISNSPDTEITSTKIVSVYEVTGRDPSTILMSEVPRTQEDITLLGDDYEPLQVLDVEKISSGGNKRYLTDAVVSETSYGLPQRVITQTVATTRPRSEDRLPAHNAISDLRTTKIAQAESLQRNLNKVASSKLPPNINSGVVRTVDRSMFEGSPKAISISPSEPISWSGVTTEKSTPPDTSSFDTVNVLNETKLSTPTMVAVGDLESKVPVPKDPYANIPFIKFGTKSSLRVKPIKGWTITKDKGGMELRVPCY